MGRSLQAPLASGLDFGMLSGLSFLFADHGLGMDFDLVKAPSQQQQQLNQDSVRFNMASLVPWATVTIRGSKVEPQPR